MQSLSKSTTVESNSRLYFEFTPELSVNKGCPDTEWILSTDRKTMAVFWFTYKEPIFKFDDVRVFDDKTIINNEPFYVDYFLHETELRLADAEIEDKFGECYQIKVITPLFSQELPLNKAYGVQRIAIDTQVPLDPKEVPTFDLLLQLTMKDQGKDVSALDFARKVRFRYVPQPLNIKRESEKLTIPMSYYTTSYYSSLPKPKIYLLSKMNSLNFPIECVDPSISIGVLDNRSSATYLSALSVFEENVADFSTSPDHQVVQNLPKWKAAVEAIEIYFPSSDWLTNEGKCFDAVLLQWEDVIDKLPSSLCQVSDAGTCEFTYDITVN